MGKPLPRSIQRLLIHRLRERNVILLVRDPRDIIVSYYFQKTKREQAVDWPLEEFIRDLRYGINQCIAFYNAVYARRHMYRNFLILRYEDIKTQPHHEAQRILQFLNFHIDTKSLQKALDETHFQKMKEKERRGVFQDEKLTTTDPHDQEAYKVRRGKIGGYAEYLNKNDINYVNKQLEQLHPAFGYHQG